MISLANLLGEFKKWLDGEEAAAMEQEPPRARREWEEFLISVAREIESVMQREMFTPPGGPTYIPPEYLVFLSSEDDAQWQGSKREGLERGLNYVLAQRVQELLGNDEVQTRSFAVELRIDGALEKGKFRVQPVWDISSPKTEVRPRRREVVAEDAATPEAEDAASDATLVRPRAPQLSITIAQGDDKAETLKFHQKQVTIGRGSKDFPVDIKLDGDLEISRKQAVIEKREDRLCILSCEGRNPIEVDGQELTQGQTIELRPGQTIRIGPYKICLPPDDLRKAAEVTPTEKPEALESQPVEPPVSQTPS